MINAASVNRTRTYLGALVGLLFVAPFAYGQAGGAAPTAKPTVIEKTRGLGQCEIFLLKGKPGNYEALVYNTIGLNDCPPSKFDPIDATELATETGSDIVWKNPRRFWMMDSLTVTLVGEPREFKGLPFNTVARMQMPANFDPARGQSSLSYQPTKIRRVSDYVFLKGRPVFMLKSPDGNAWVMQTYTTHTDASLTQADLPNLGQRLKLPSGWQFKSKTIDKDLVIHTTGLANIVPDNLENMYQGCIDGVCNFDPWN